MKTPRPDVSKVLKASKKLTHELNKIKFPKEIFVYNTYEYAWHAHKNYIEKYLNSPLKALFMGMNPGPYGMMQSGVPFGDVLQVKKFLKISDGVSPPTQQHPHRPILGFDSTRREISGLRFWGLIEKNSKAVRTFLKIILYLIIAP